MIWSLATTLTILIGVWALVFTVNQSKQRQKQLFQRAQDELHPLLKDNTVFRSYKTQYAEYPRIRTFYHPHVHKHKHTNIDSLPLLVVIHGLGGVLPQFAPILGSLKNIAPCFGLELPGHGQSSFMPTGYNAYTIEAFTALWKVAIEDICNQYGHQNVVLIGHSMGCSIAALLTSTSSFTPTISQHFSVLGLVAICPRGNSISPAKATSYQRILSLPIPVINLLRWFDRRGGGYSMSVTRIVGNSTEPDLRRTQLGWNRQFQTRVWKRSTLGLLPRRGEKGNWIGGFPDLSVWEGIRAPILLIAGRSDQVTPATESSDIFHHLTGHTLKDLEDRQSEAKEVHQGSIYLQPVTLGFSEQQQTIQAITLPAPAAHALLYAHSTYRIVAALVEAYLATHVSEHLDFGYQLRILTTSGKWDVKNLEKWKAVLPVSGPIAVISSSGPNGVFRALKTMREQDEEHNPTVFLQKWSNHIYAVIDISHDAPVYNTKLLDQGGVEYHKFPTVSKVPPSPVEVQDFCSLVDKLIVERDAKLAASGSNSLQKRAIAVHCHYGYNRTGFFICSYLILEMGFSVHDAIDEFRKAKPPGIRHEHFLDMLWLRYSGVSSPSPLHSHEIELKGDAERDKVKKKKKKEEEEKTKSQLTMTSREDANSEKSAKSSANSLVLPTLDLDAGVISEGDLM